MKNNKIKTIFITILLLAVIIPSTTPVSNIVAGDSENDEESTFKKNNITINPMEDEYVEFEILPNTEQLFNQTQTNVSIYITLPEGQYNITTFTTDLITFSKDKLQAISVEKGDILGKYGGTQIFEPGTINNEEGYIENIWWTCNIPAYESGYFVNITFDILEKGNAWVKINTCEAAYGGIYVPTKVVSNYTLFSYDIIVSDEYPQNNSRGMDRTELLSINASSASGTPMHIFWSTNMTGEYRLLGYNLSVPGGRYHMSCYGVVESPYNQTLQYEFNDRNTGIFLNNTCVGKDVGVIKRVHIYAPSYVGVATPVFKGTYEGEKYNIEEINDYIIEITNDKAAPTEWKWNDVRDLALKISNTTTYVIVTYDIRYGYGQTVYWNVEVTDGYHWVNNTFNYQIERYLPEIKNPSPRDAHDNVQSRTVLLSADVNDPEGTQMTISFWTNKSGSWQQIGSNQNGYNGTYSQQLVLEDFSTWYWWRIKASNSQNETQRTFRFRMRDIFRPEEPKNTEATAINETAAIIGWEIDEHTDYSLIKRRTDRYPEFEDPGQIYYGNETEFIDNSLQTGTLYYYRIWNYNQTDDAWSHIETIENCSSMELTYAYTPTELFAETLSYDQIELTWIKGEGADTTVIRRKIGSYPTSPTDGTLIYNGAGTYHLDSQSMGGNITYYYRAWSYVSKESLIKYSLEYSEDYNVTEIGPPTVTTNAITYININDITLNGHLISDGGETATVGFKWGNSTFFDNQTIGTRNTGQSFSYKLPSLSYATTYYVQAWAYNGEGYVEGVNMSFSTGPMHPTNFIVETIDEKSMNLFWDVNPGSDKTRVVMKEDEYPTSPYDGELIYFGDGSSYLLNNIGKSIPILTEYHTDLNTMIYPICGGTGSPYFDDREIYGTTYGAQTFTVGYRGMEEDYYLRNLSLRLFKSGNPGPITVTITNATKVENARVTTRYLINPSWGNAYDIIYPKNTNDALGSAQKDGATIISNAHPGEWVVFNFNEPILLKSGETYTIVVRAPWGTASHYIKWVKDSAYSTHEGGDSFISTNAGSTWNEIYYQYSDTWGYQYGRADFNFQLYGNTLTGLESNKTYYFSAWSYNQTQSLFSETYPSEINTTNVGRPKIKNINVTEIEDTTAKLHSFLIFDKGEACEAGFIYGTSPSTLNENVSISGTWSSNTSLNKTISGLSKATTYYYKAWVRNSAGYYYDYAIHNFHTKPSETNSLSSTPWGADQINLTWVKGSGGDISIVVRKIGSYPTNITEGIERYRGTDSYFIDHFTNEKGNPVLEPMFENTNYYYRVWTYNESNNHYSTSYEQTTSKTEIRPELDEIKPPQMSVNVDTPPQLSAKATADYEPIQVTFWNPNSLNMGDKLIASGGSGWSDSDRISNTGTGYTSVRRSYCWYNYYYIRDFAFSSASGYYNIQTPKLTAYLDQPKMISGIQFSYGRMYNAHGGGTYYLDGYKTWHLEYHDFYNDEWIPATHYAEWGETEIYIDDLIVIDKVRIWLQSTSESNYIIRVNPRVNYIYFVAPSELDTKEINSGNEATYTWNDATEPNERYYWALTANDGRTIIGSNVKYFITEKFDFMDEVPEDKEIVQDTPTHNCSVSITQSRGDPFDVTLYAKIGSNWVAQKQYNDVYNGSFFFIYHDSGNHGTTYHWRVRADDGGIVDTRDYSFTIRASFIPNTPTMTVTTHGPEQINITNMHSNEHADTIMLRFKEDGYPANVGDGILLQNSTSSTFIHDGLTPGRTYYYAAWAYNQTDNVWSSRRTATASTPGPLVTFKTYAIDRNNINITNITGNEFTDSIMIRYSTDNYPSTRSDGSLVANIDVGTTYFIHGSLDEHTQHYYAAWAYNETFDEWSIRFIETTGFLHEGYTTKPGRTRGPVNLTNFYPANNQENVSMNTNLQVRTTNYESTGPMTIHYRTNSSGSWATIDTKVDVADGIHTISTTHFPEQLKWYWYSINATDGDFWTNQTVTFKTKSVDAPSALVAKVPRINGQINLTWINIPEAESTVIVRKIGSYPNSPTDGVEVYNGTGEYYNDTGLDNGIIYYYRSYSYLDGRYSTSFGSARALTHPLQPTDVVVERTGHRSIRISWTKGEGSDKTHIMMFEDFYPMNTTHGTFVYNSTGNYVDVTGLKPGDYLNYFTPKGNVNTMGNYFFGGDFSKSYDGNTSTSWDLAPNKVGEFSYIFNVSLPFNNSGYYQEMDALQRIYSYRILAKDFYNEPGQTWNASITKAQTYNGTWNMFWEGNFHTVGTEKKWWRENVELDHKEVSEIKFDAWSDYIVANIYEIELGKLGYTYKFALWGVAEKNGLLRMSVDNATGKNVTDDTPKNHIPEITIINPTADKTGLEHKPVTFTISINDADGDRMNIDWMTNITGEWETFYATNDVGNGTYSTQSYLFEEYATEYWWRVNVTDDSDSLDSVYNTNYNKTENLKFRTREEIKPEAPKEFIAESYELRSMNLTWIKGNNSDKTAIFMKEGDYPANRQDGLEVYNGSALKYKVLSLKPETMYYFKAWGWNNTDNRFSDTTAQAFNETGENQRIILSSENPLNNTIEISRHIERVEINITDLDGDEIEYYIWGEYVNDVNGTNHTSGIKNATLKSPIPGNTEVIWYVEAFDGYHWTNATYNFTVKDNAPPIQYNELPENKSMEIHLMMPYVYINISDPEGDPLEWIIHGNYITYTHTTGDINGTKQAEVNTPLPLESNITWYVNLTDGEFWVNRTYWFNTSTNNPPDAPSDGYVTSRRSTDETYMDVYDVWLNCTVSDPDGDAMDVHFYWGNDTYIGTLYDVASNTEASLYIPDHWTRNILGYDVPWLEHNTIYNWYAVADDRTFNTTSPTWEFLTGMAWDIAHNRQVGPADVTLLVTYYGSISIPGQSYADISENGNVGPGDVTLLVTYYGSIY
jgi:hypothetical protein